MGRLYNKRGQVWVETVIYTLIGLVIIGLVLAAAKPKIDAKRDEVVIEQAIEALGNINDKIYEVQRAVGNRRTIDLKIGKGTMVIDIDSDTISWVIDSSFEYSEGGTVVPIGSLDVLTEESSPWKVTLLEEYNVDIQYLGQAGGTKELSSASVPYSLVIENSGRNGDDDMVITISAS
jgi:type II secretory pathway pseudopilin PulG